MHIQFALINLSLLHIHFSGIQQWADDKDAEVLRLGYVCLQLSFQYVYFLMSQRFALIPSRKRCRQCFESLTEFETKS